MLSQYRVNEMTGNIFHKLPQSEKEYYLNKAFEYWRKKGFPYTNLNQSEIIAEYKLIEDSNCEQLIKNKRINHSSVGLRLANYFHPQIWHIKKYGHKMAPIDHFNLDATLYNLLERATKLYPTEFCWVERQIRGMFRIHCGGRIANFRPTAAKAIIQRYSDENAEILDFCAGFGGRLLGSLCLKRHYVGIDASRKQAAGCRRLEQTLRKYALGTAEIHHGNSEDILSTFKSKSFDLVFSSPPYFNQEKYSPEKSQSFLRYPTYSDWTKNFLKPIIKESHRVLKTGGYFVVNIADTKQHCLATDFESHTSEIFKLKTK